MDGYGVGLVQIMNLFPAPNHLHNHRPAFLVEDEENLRV